MEFISNKRDLNTWWGTYQCGNGDLVSMSYLDNTRFKLVRDRPLPKPNYLGPKKVNLYLSGDSYTRGVRDSIFSGINHYYRHDRYYNKLYYKLDNSHTNILILEITEREFRDYFNSARVIDEVVDSAKLKIAKTTIKHKHHYAGFPSIPIDNLFNKYINQNLQCNLFNYNYFMPVFETKAAFNYYFFNRASGDVIISKDKNYLFLKETALPEGPHSSYSQLTDAEVDFLVDNLNKIYEHYKVEGFSEIYLSVIPNTATIVQPKGYNFLIPRIQNHMQLKMKTIDVYSVFNSNTSIDYFHHGDTHWNNNGLKVWLNKVNENLGNWNTKNEFQ